MTQLEWKDIGYGAYRATALKGLIVCNIWWQSGKRGESNTSGTKARVSIGSRYWEKKEFHNGLDAAKAWCEKSLTPVLLKVIGEMNEYIGDTAAQAEAEIEKEVKE